MKLKRNRFNQQITTVFGCTMNDQENFSMIHPTNHVKKPYIFLNETKTTKTQLKKPKNYIHITIKNNNIEKKQKQKTCMFE